MDHLVATRVDALRASTATLFRTLDDFDEQLLRGPSLLPGWSRAHVLAHLARNADAMVNLATWARTGDETPMYASYEKRNADIEAGAGRSLTELVADVRASDEHMMDALNALTTEQWSSTIRWGRAQTEGAASAIPNIRRAEVEIHHLDLDVGYGLAQFPDDFVDNMLVEVADDFSGRDDAPGLVLVADDGRRWVVEPGGQEVHGRPAALLGYLLGRTDGEDLQTDGELPKLGAWR
ncbi:maleylpyruvate isomerase family mycothiol-dependent enzyme [Aeromicrobium sp.]|uniref:maleylpyruvate isomerase family mycothiol-dependent enzyme n=1 Tax=Aeromicrobium sp. TaxID=1871063 RepID=UPI003D6B0A36